MNNDEISNFRDRLGKVLENHAKGESLLVQKLLKGGIGFVLRIRKADLTISGVRGSVESVFGLNKSQVIGASLTKFIGKDQIEATSKQISETGVARKVITLGDRQVMAIAWDENDEEIGELLIMV